MGRKTKEQKQLESQAAFDFLNQFAEKEEVDNGKDFCDNEYKELEQLGIEVFEMSEKLDDIIWEKLGTYMEYSKKVVNNKSFDKILEVKSLLQKALSFLQNASDVMSYFDKDMRDFEKENE
jgi:hypothetical protein